MASALIPVRVLLLPVPGISADIIYGSAGSPVQCMLGKGRVAVGRGDVTCPSRSYTSVQFLFGGSFKSSDDFFDRMALTGAKIVSDESLVGCHFS